jgi:hypothetical protein
MKLLLATFLAFSSTVMLANNASAQATRPQTETIVSDPFAAMEEFARCGARFEHAADMSQSAGMPASAEEYMGTARGSRVVSDFFASYLALQTAGDDADAFADAQRQRLDQAENFYQLEVNTQRAWSERGQFDKEGFQYCFDLQPLQIRVIEQMRRDGMP